MTLQGKLHTLPQKTVLTFQDWPSGPVGSVTKGIFLTAKLSIFCKHCALSHHRSIFRPYSKKKSCLELKITSENCPDFPRLAFWTCSNIINILHKQPFTQAFPSHTPEKKTCLELKTTPDKLDSHLCQAQ